MRGDASVGVTGSFPVFLIQAPLEGRKGRGESCYFLITWRQLLPSNPVSGLFALSGSSLPLQQWTIPDLTCSSHSSTHQNRHPFRSSPPSPFSLLQLPHARLRPHHGTRMITTTTESKSIKILILGFTGTGKSAIAVRYLTKRFIGEYSSVKDFLYHHVVNLDETQTEVAIMDASGIRTGQSLHKQIAWADAYIVTYSICDMESFSYAVHLLETISVLRGATRPPVLLLGNKKDLEHNREVSVETGQETSLRYQCQFNEVSAAESYISISLAFQNLIKQTQPFVRSGPTLRRKTSPSIAVSRMIGLVFGKGPRAGKKRPSLSI